MSRRIHVLLARGTARFDVSCVLIAALTFAACGDDGDDGTPINMVGGDAGATGGDAAAACTADTYLTYGQKFFMTNCTACHSAMLDMSKMMNVKLDTPPGIKAAQASIIKHAVQLQMPIMPLGGALPEAERQRLQKWLSCGAP